MHPKPSGGAAESSAEQTPRGCPDCGADAPPPARFCSQCGARLAAGQPAAVGGRSARPPQSERRQVTVLFCDLVGSTELSARLDPEEMCQLMERYQDTCARAMAPYEGQIAQTLGDGLLVYFGYPEAHEDDGRRAVLAGLAIVEAIADPRNQVRAGETPCAVRVGIHTGLVIAGELSRWDTRADMALVGETPNVAARLQALARPNQVLLGPKTQRLVEGHVELHALGPQPIKGLEQPLQVWEARRATPAQARATAPSTRVAAPLFGRQAELDQLRNHWRNATEGAGQVVVVAGAAGMGKSRLLEALRASLSPGAALQLRYHCSPYFQNTALHPIVEQLEYAAGFHPEDAGDVRLRKLEQLLSRSSERLAHDTALVAQLLQLPLPAAARPALSPQRLLDDIVEVLITQLVQLAQRAPLLMTLEDAHWIDPTTSSFLQRLSARLSGSRILVVITHRTRFSQPWTQSHALTHLVLDRLSPVACRDLIAHVSAPRRLPERVVEEIVARGDGLPLFVEELTKAVLDTDDQEAAMRVPSSLQDSLTARLDRLGALKVVVQLAACIGRSFPHSLLARICDLEAQQLQAGLLRLVAAELLVKRGEFPEARLRFRHALLQNAAYESLLRSERRRVHAAIAHALEASPGEVDHQPEVLAQHWAAAGEHERALPYWLAAGRSAQRRSAHVEALAHLEAWLRSLQLLPRSGALDIVEIDFQLAVARSHTAGEGWSGRRVHDAYARALELSRALGEAARECEVLWGLCADHTVRGELEQAGRRAGEFVRIAQQTGDRRALLMADAAALLVHFCQGDFAAAQGHADRIHARYQPERDADLAHLFNHDPEVIASMYEGHWLCLQGRGEAAVDASRRAIDRGRQLRQPFQLCYALINGSAASVWRTDHATVLAQIDEALELAAESRIPVFQVYGPLFGAAAFAERDRSPRVRHWLRQCLETMRASQALMHVPFYELQLAAAYELAGDRAEAAYLIERGLALAEHTGERWMVPELRRVQARLMRPALAAPDPTAERLLRRGLDEARILGATSLALRLSLDLAELLCADERSDEALIVLGGALEGCEEDGHGPELKRARLLHESLERARGSAARAGPG